MEAIRAAALAWYDAHRRVLPWRAEAGARMDPYRVWLSEVMLQQTTVPAVIPYFLKFTEKWPTVQALAAAPLEDVLREWAGLGYYARARNLHRCAQVVARERAGVFPSDPEELRTLPGIGAYTAGAIAAIAFDVPAAAMDGNVERVLARVFHVTEPLPAAKTPLRALAKSLFEGEARRPGDLVQAVMDLGSGVCTPRAPKCLLCPLAAFCEALKAGDANSLPRRAAKSEKPMRQGYVYWIVGPEGRILTQTRPPKGLLGGMVGLPTSAWSGEDPGHADFIDPRSVIPEGKVLHTFTHFHLTLCVCRADLHSQAAAGCEGAAWRTPTEAAQAMPSVFRKAVRLMVGR
jgi:A/G-specific adenine glycosylase